MIKLLLDQGATINAFDKKDRRAIHWAAYMGHVEIVRMLVDHGAELNCQDKQVCDLSMLWWYCKIRNLRRGFIFAVFVS